MREQTPYGEIPDEAYYSCDMGMAKPSAGFFGYIVSDLGLAPGQVLFIDDQPQNVPVPDRPDLTRSSGRTSTGSPGCATSSPPTAYGWTDRAT